MAGQRIAMKKLFILVLCLKVCSSLLGWWFGSPWLLGFAVPMAVMALYIVAGSAWRDRDELSDEKFADSCYYLGFIFTISSIIVCLFDLPNIAGQLAEIAIRFGAAMVSTVLGLTVRVYLVNFRKDVHDIARSVEDDLLVAAKKLRTQLELATDGLRIFNDSVDDATTTALSKVRQAMEESAGHFTAHFTELFEQIATDHRFIASTALEQTEAATQSLGGLLRRHTEAVDEHARQLREGLEAFADDLRQRLGQVQFPDDYFSKALTAPVEELSSSVARMAGRVEETAERLQGNTVAMTKALEGITETADGARWALHRIMTAAAQEMEAIRRELAGQTGGVSLELGGLAERLAATTAQLQRHAGELTQTRDLLGALRHDHAQRSENPPSGPASAQATRLGG